MLIEHFSAKCWLIELRQRYSLEETIFRDSPEAFTILISKGNRNTIVARFDRTRQYGFVYVQK